MWILGLKGLRDTSWGLDCFAVRIIRTSSRVNSSTIMNAGMPLIFAHFVGGVVWS